MENPSILRMEAFEQLVLKHYGVVYLTAYARLANRELAEDATQEAFLRAYLCLDRLIDTRGFGPWVCCIARNIATDWLRSPGHRVHILSTENLEVAANMPDKSMRGPRECAIESERREQVAIILAKLSPQLREVVLLRYVEDLSLKEIGELIDLHPTTVGYRLGKAMRQCRQLAGVKTAIHEDVTVKKEALARVVISIGTICLLSPTSRQALAAKAAPSIPSTISSGILTGSKISSWLLKPFLCAPSAGIIIGSCPTPIAVGVVAVLASGVGYLAVRDQLAIAVPARNTAGPAMLKPNTTQLRQETQGVNLDEILKAQASYWEKLSSIEYAYTTVHVKENAPALSSHVPFVNHGVIGLQDARFYGSWEHFNGTTMTTFRRSFNGTEYILHEPSFRDIGIGLVNHTPGDPLQMPNPIKDPFLFANDPNGENSYRTLSRPEMWNPARFNGTITGFITYHGRPMVSVRFKQSVEGSDSYSYWQDVLFDPTLHYYPIKITTSYLVQNIERSDSVEVTSITTELKDVPGLPVPLELTYRGFGKEGVITFENVSKIDPSSLSVNKGIPVERFSLPKQMPGWCVVNVDAKTVQTTNPDEIKKWWAAIQPSTARRTGKAFWLVITGIVFGFSCWFLPRRKG